MTAETPSLSNLAFRCVCGAAPTPAEASKPDWAVFAGCGAQMAMAWKRDEAAAEHQIMQYWLSPTPPMVGTDGWVRLDMPFPYAADQDFWWLWEPAESHNVGYEDALDRMADMCMVRSRLYDLRRSEFTHGIARAEILEIVTLADLKTMPRSPQPVAANIWTSMPIHRDWTLRHGDLILAGGDIEGDAGGWVLLWEHDGDVDLLVQTIGDEHADHVFAGRAPLRVNGSDVGPGLPFWM